VGRIRRATGTNDKDVFKAIDTMLTQLYQQARFDLLESLRDKKLSLMEVYADWRVKGVERLPSAATLGPVIPRWEKWTATLEAEHRRVAAGWGEKVMGKHLPDAAAIRALPDAVRAIQNTFAAQPRSANLMRSFVLAFLRDTVGRGSPVYSEVVSLRPVKQPRKTPRAKPTLDDVRTMAEVLGPQHAPIVWTLALTGMRPKELWVTPWKVMADRVRIEGSKSAGSFRDVPLLGVITKPAVAHVTFRKAFKAKYANWRVYDLRHAYAGLLEDAGVPRTRRLLYMGRGPKDVQDLYEFREVSAYLCADAERIMTHLDQLGGIRPTLKVMGKK
jgi:integrase